MVSLKRLCGVLLSAALSLSLCASLTPRVSAEIINIPRELSALSGAPIDKDGKQYNSLDDTVIPGQTLYFLLPGDAGKLLGNTRNVRMSYRKTTNSKYISRVYLTERILTSKKDAYYYVPSGVKDKNYYTTNAVRGNARNQYVAVELKDYTGSEEIAIGFDVTFTVRRDSSTGYGFSYGMGTTQRKKEVTDPSIAATVNNPTFLDNSKFKSTGDRITLSAKLYVGNKSSGGYDTTVTVGGSGKTIKIAAADDNFVSFDTNYDTIATLSFVGSSNPDDFIARLSTKWPSDLLRKFRDTDAVIWRFTPANIDCVSRAELALANPFTEDPYVNPKRVYIYSVDSKGILRDVTKSFTYDSDEDVFMIRTRTLNTYIISDRKINLR